MCELILSQEERDAIDREHILARAHDPETSSDQAAADALRMAEITVRSFERCREAFRRAGLLP